MTSGLWKPDSSRSRVAVYVLTVQGFELATRIIPALAQTGIAAPDETDLFVPLSLRDSVNTASCSSTIHWFSRLKTTVQSVFHSYKCHVFITAAGAAIRCFASSLHGKDQDPAALVLDQCGRFVISLLSGHLGGANAMARQLADAIGATPVITTATDVEDLPALDVMAHERGLAISNLFCIKSVSASLLAGKMVNLYDPYNHLGLRGSKFQHLFHEVESIQALHEYSQNNSVVVSEQTNKSNHGGKLQALWLHPRSLYVGLGCRRGVGKDTIIAAIKDIFTGHGLAMDSLSLLASIEAKRDERGLYEAAQSLATTIRYFSIETLARYPVQVPSLKARELFGIDGVCEPAALAAAESSGRRARLLVPKAVCHGVTVAVALQVFP